MPCSSEDLIAAQQLRAAAQIVERYAPADDYRQLRDRTNILRLIGLAIASLEKPLNREVCRRCGSMFAFDHAWFASRHLDLPRHCPTCR